LHTGAFFEEYGAQYFEGATRAAHRVAYCKHHGLRYTDIKGKVVRHACDNPPCINPVHLILGTQAENMRDKRERNRAARLFREDNPNCHLTREQVTKILSLYVRGSKEYSARKVGALFGVTHTTILKLAKETKCSQ
jgi:hypothetical protein